MNPMVKHAVDQALMVSEFSAAGQCATFLAAGKTDLIDVPGFYPPLEPWRYEIFTALLRDQMVSSILSGY